MPQSKSRPRIVSPQGRPAGSDDAIVKTGDLEIKAGDPAVGFYGQAADILRSFKFDTSDPDVARRIIEWGREQHELRRRGLEGPTRGRFTFNDPDPHDAVVYYMRVGNRVKIGWSTNLRARLASLAPEELLAVEKGGLSIEKQRHRQFNALHTAGEWFRLEPPLTGHIEVLQRLTAHFSGRNLQ